MKILLIAALLILPLDKGVAADFFVDAQLGVDSNLGTTHVQSGNGDGPWRSLSRLRAADVQPGDRILLHCGSNWYEPIHLKLKGTAESPIIIAAYGDCNGKRPRISPADVVLLPESFEATPMGWAAPLSAPPGLVYTQDALLPRARFPVKRTLPLAVVNGSIKLNLSALPVAGHVLKGADWVVRTNDYTLEERRLYGVGAQGETLNAKPFAMQPVSGAGYYLEGQPWMLAYADGWAHDPQTGRLFVRQRPTMPLVVNNSPVALAISQSEYLRVQGIAIRFVSGVGVEVANSRQIELDDLEIRDVGTAFIRAQNVEGLIVKRLQGQRSQRDGVVIKQGSGSEVLDSLLEDVGVSANPRKSIAAILIDESPAAVVARNRIFRTGYAAIMFGKEAHVVRNVIEKSCLVLADCGAIYTSGARKSHGYYNARVEDNLISDVSGSLEGSMSRSALTAGVYLDDESRGIYVRRNFVEKAQRGVFSKATATHVSDNVLFNNEFGIMLSRTGARGSGEDATHILNNVVVSKNKQTPFLVSAENSGEPVVDVRHNRVRTAAGALASQVWMGSATQPAPLMSDMGKIRQSLSLTNTSGVRQTYTCPLAKPICDALRLPDGTLASWPVDLAPGMAVVLVVEGGEA